MKGQTLNTILGIEEESDDEEMEVEIGQPNETEQMEVSVTIMHLYIIL